MLVIFCYENKVIHLLLEISVKSMVFFYRYRLPSKRQRSPSPAPGMQSSARPGPSGAPKRQKVDAAAQKRCHACSIMVQAVCIFSFFVKYSGFKVETRES